MVDPVIDEKVRKFLKALFKKGGNISYGIVSTTANVLLSRSEDLSLKNIKTTPMWGRSIVQRVGFRRRVATTGKVEVPEGARKEAGLQHHFRIVNIIEKRNIPKSFVLNSDQTSSKYVTVGRTTMAPKNSTRVGLAGSTDKRSITLTLTVPLDGKVLQFKIIYGDKTDQSLPKITFPAKFSTSVNEKHYSNTEEVIKHLQGILIPYVNEERKKIGDADQYALLIWAVLRGQKTEAVTSLLQEQKILNEYVPNNMTDYFQVLNLTVNKWVKDFMKQKFNEWFATQSRNELESGKELENITIKFLLLTMKPLHAGWLIDCYNQLTSSHGKDIILAGWRASRISAAAEDGLIGFLIDPFNEIDPFDQTIEINMISVVPAISEEYINKEKVFHDCDSDDEFCDLENTDFYRE